MLNFKPELIILEMRHHPNLKIGQKEKGVMKNMKLKRILCSADRLFRVFRFLSVAGLLLAASFLVIALLPLSFGAVNTNFTLSLWSMPIIYNLNNGDYVSLAVPGDESVVETEFYTNAGCKDAVAASYTAILYREELGDSITYYSVINLEVQTDRLPYATATAIFDVEVAFMKDGSLIEYLFVMKDGPNVQTDILNFTYIASKFSDGNYSIVYRGLARYSINTLIEKTNESRGLDFGYLNITIKNQKVTYVHHKFNVIREILSRKTINPTLFKAKTWAPPIVILGMIFQIPPTIYYIKHKFKPEIREGIES